MQSRRLQPCWLREEFQSSVVWSCLRKHFASLGDSVWIYGAVSNHGNEGRRYVLLPSIWQVPLWVMKYILHSQNLLLNVHVQVYAAVQVWGDISGADSLFFKRVEWRNRTGCRESDVCLWCWIFSQWHIKCLGLLNLNVFGRRHNLIPAVDILNIHFSKD